MKFRRDTLGKVGHPDIGGSNAADATGGRQFRACKRRGVPYRDGLQSERTGSAARCDC